MTAVLHPSEVAPAGADRDIDTLAVDTIRFLAAEMVQAANSGHPGMPMGAAGMAWALFSRHLRHDPTEPGWADRDRFVLSAGHGSALQYALLHLFGYDLPMQELRAFRRLGSATPGHPEYGHTPGVETTTGPLGQGFANAVGMALAERMLAAEFPELTDHHTYAIVGDGCLMEGISHEAASLAGHLRLGRLIVLWDDNEITIDGSVGRSCSDDQSARFAACGWHTLQVGDGSDVTAVDAALAAAKADPRPSLIAVRTVIGHGAPGVEGTAKAHGSPLGADVLAAAKAAAGWPAEPFTLPEPVRSRCLALAATGTARRLAWEQTRNDLDTADPARADAWRRRQTGALPNRWADLLRELREQFRPGGASDAVAPRATRAWSRDVLRALSAHLPDLVGGSADLAGSTGVAIGAHLVAAGSYGGTAVAFGIREHAMAAVLNGLSLHGGFRPYGSTFAVFSDYLRPALRLSALMGQPVVHIFSHDSVAVGEDGPTHQPVEHLEALRLIPGLQVLRPADDIETITAWALALERRNGPTALLLSRQILPALPDRGRCVDNRLRIVHDDGSPNVEFLATGSEVHLAVEVAELLGEHGVRCRVVSVLDREALERRGRWALLTVSVEAGLTAGWRHLADLCIGIDRFGVCGPGDVVMSSLGLDAEDITAQVLAHPKLTGGRAVR